MIFNEEFFSDMSGNHKIFDLYRYEPLQKYLYNDELSEEDIKELNRWLKAHKDDYVCLYHGTSSKNDIMTDGLLRTTMKRRRSYQSASGWVYLSVFPSTARTFGEMGYPLEEITVYKVTLPTLKGSGFVYHESSKLDSKPSTTSSGNISRRAS